MPPWKMRKKYPNTWKQEHRFAIILGITLIVFYSCLQFFSMMIVTDPTLSAL